MCNLGSANKPICNHRKKNNNNNSKKKKKEKEKKTLKKGPKREGGKIEIKLRTVSQARLGDSQRNLRIGQSVSQTRL